MKLWSFMTQCGMVRQFGYRVLGDVKCSCVSVVYFPGEAGPWPGLAELGRAFRTETYGRSHLGRY